MNDFDAHLERNVTDPMKDQPDVTATYLSFSEDDVIVEDNDEDKTEAVPESHTSVTPNNADRADANPESPPRIQNKINIPEVPTPSQTVFTPEQK